jgi:hypothetical protein
MCKELILYMPEMNERTASVQHQYLTIDFASNAYVLGVSVLKSSYL